jgi:hypothetical protein
MWLILLECSGFVHISEDLDRYSKSVLEFLITFGPRSKLNAFVLAQPLLSPLFQCDQGMLAIATTNSLLFFHCQKVNICSPLARWHARRNGIAAYQRMGIDLLSLKDLSRASGLVEPGFEHRCFPSIFIR